MIKNNFYIVKYFINHCPLFLFTYLLLEILTSISHVLLLPYSLLIATDASLTESGVIRGFIILFIIFIFSCILSLFRSLFEDIFTIKAKEKVNCLLQIDLYKVAKSVDLLNYDIPEFYDDLHYSIDKIDVICSNVLDTLKKTVYSITAIISIMGIIFSLSPIALLFVFINFLLNILCENATKSIEFKLNLEQNKFIRKKDYIRRIFFLPKYIREIQLNSLSKLLINNFKNESNNEIDSQKKYVFALFMLKGPINTLIDFIFGFVIFNSILIYQIVCLNSLTIGGFSALFFASGSLKSNLNSFTEVFGQLKDNSLKIQHFINFIDRNKNIHNELISTNFNIDAQDVSIKNLSFNYYNSHVKVLDNINLEISKGETVAIVGRNGAGKTTLIKLLLKLYSPSSGQILFGKDNIQNIPSNLYRLNFGTLFQNFNIYAMSLRENIVLDTINNNINIDSVLINVLKLSGFYDEFKSMPSGLDTMLLNEYEENGINLSGGQSQKIALARVLFSNKNFIILDEPSSALDPISEYNFNNKIIKHFKDKTIFIISHRLSTTSLCDQIILLDKGKIIEKGTHNELMKLNGEYKHMYDVQANQYI